MKKKLGLGFLVSLLVLASATASVVSVAPASADLSVDEYLFAGIVSTELVSAVRCPIPTLGCNHVNDDCGIYAGVCHCKAGGVGGGTLVCVKNP